MLHQHVLAILHAYAGELEGAGPPIKLTAPCGTDELLQISVQMKLHPVQVETFRPTRPLLSGDAAMSHAGDPEAAGPPLDWGSYSFLNIKRYRQYFNVDTYVRKGPRAAPCLEPGPCEPWECQGKCGRPSHPSATGHAHNALPGLIVVGMRDGRCTILWHEFPAGQSYAPIGRRCWGGCWTRWWARTRRTSSRRPRATPTCARPRPATPACRLHQQNICASGLVSSRSSLR